MASATAEAGVIRLAASGQVAVWRCGSNQVIGLIGQLEAKGVLLVTEPEIEEVVQAVRGRPGSTQARLIELMGAKGWARSTTQHRLGRAVDEGLLRVSNFGRAVVYAVQIRQ